MSPRNAPHDNLLADLPDLLDRAAQAMWGKSGEELTALGRILAGRAVRLREAKVAAVVAATRDDLKKLLDALQWDDDCYAPAHLVMPLEERVRALSRLLDEDTKP